MRKGFFFIFLLISLVSFSQEKNNVSITKTGNNSFVIINQGGVHKFYDLNNPKEFEKLVSEISKFSKEFKTLFSDLKSGQKKQYDELKSNQKLSLQQQKGIKSKIDSIPRQVLEGLLSDTAAYSILKLEITIKEREKALRKIEDELKSYKIQNPSLGIVLDSANKKMNENDLIGYHSIMEGLVSKSTENAVKGCYLRAKNYEANFLFQDALLQFERAYSFDTTNTKLFISCAIAANKAGYQRKAIFYFGKALESKQLLNYERVEVLEALGRCLIYVNLDQSLVVLREAEKLVMNDYKVDAIGTLVRLSLIKNSIGEVLLNIGKTSNAIEEFQSSILVSNLIRYPNNEITALAYKRMGTAFFGLKNADSTIFYMSIAEQIFRRHLISKYYNEIADINNYVGVVYFNLNNLEEALGYFNYSYFLLNNFINLNSPLSGDVVANIGHCHLKLGNKEIAKKYFLQSKSILVKFLGENNVSVIDLQKIINTL